MATITVIQTPPKPPTVEKVILELSLNEARLLHTLLGKVSNLESVVGRTMYNLYCSFPDSIISISNAFEGTIIAQHIDESLV